MKVSKFASPMIVLMLCLATAAGSDRSMSFVTIDYPGATLTIAYGINPAGDIVGYYNDTLGSTHGFVLRQGMFSSFDYPGAATTYGYGINPGGEIVGSFRMPGETPVSYHGYFLKRDGTFVPIDNYPGHINMIAQRILPDGAVLGCYHDYDTMASMHGFVLSNGQYSDVGVGASMNNGATPDLSLITGFLYDMAVNRWRSYVVQNGSFTPFDFPGASTSLTQAWDTNPSGAIVGQYIDSTGSHGFLLEDGQFTSISFPGATATRAHGINPGGDIVGRYVDSSGKTHGFLASRTQQHNQPN